MNRSSPLIGVLLLGVAAFVGWFLGNNRRMNGPVSVEARARRERTAQRPVGVAAQERLLASFTASPPATSPPTNTGFAVVSERPGGGVPTIKPPGPDREAVRAAIDRVSPLVKGCYEAARRQHQQAAADAIIVEFDLVAQAGLGRIEAPEVAHGVFTNALDEQCVLNALSDANFPMPPGAAARQRVRYPFQF